MLYDRVGSIYSFQLLKFTILPHSDAISERNSIHLIKNFLIQNVMGRYCSLRMDWHGSYGLQSTIVDAASGFEEDLA